MTTFISGLILGFAIWMFPQHTQAESQPILSASELNYPPFSIVHNNGADGFSVELMRAAINAMGRDVTFEIGPWAKIKRDLEEGRLEALPLVGRTPERESAFDFTVPYLSLYGAVFVREDEHGVERPEDLYGRSVGVLKGDNAEEYVRRDKITDKITATETYDEAFRQLAEGEIEAVVAQRLVGLTLIQKHGYKNIKTAIAPLMGLRQDFCFAVTDGNKELLALLNEGLSVVIANGTYELLREKWLGILDREKHQQVLLLQTTAGILGSFVILLIILFLYLHWREHLLLKANEEKFRSLFQNMPQGAFYQRADGVLIDINPAGLELFGLTRDHFLRRTSMSTQWEVIDENGSKLEGEQHPSMQALSTGMPVKGATVAVFNPKKSCYVWLSVNAIPQFLPGQDRPYQVFVTMHDISAVKHAEQTLKMQATHDQLTGLYNHQELENLLIKNTERAIRYKQCLSLFMLDLDHFKQINDNYGHQIGDNALISIAKLLEQSIRSSDYAARYGGEEFVIVLPETSLIQAREMAERLCRKVSENPIQVENSKLIRLTISIGIATFPEHAKTWKLLIHAADKAMYAAKNAGRNQVKTACMNNLDPSQHAG